jgi:hypothetical protein
MRIIVLRLLMPLPLVAVLWGLAKPAAQPPKSRLSENCPQLPASVRPIVNRACLDCHSNETKWPWYNRVPLVSWVIQHDVDNGRKHLDFSAWIGAAPHHATPNEIQEICDAVSDGVMPPRSYRLMHSNASLSSADKDIFCAWADEVRSGTALAERARR